MPPVSTAEVCEAAGAARSTVYRWSRVHKVLPAYIDAHGGRVGRSALWPAETLEIARLVREMLRCGLSFEQIRSVQATVNLERQQQAVAAGSAAVFALLA